MVVLQSRKIAAIFAAAAAFLAMGASPAMAQSAAASTQITSAVKPADQPQTPLAEGDNEFRQLFASWKSLDSGIGVVGAKTPRSAVSIPSRMPVGGVRLSSDYGERTHPILGGRRNHKGVDLAGPAGTPVFATADGIVSKAERFSSYGNYIQIEHGGELQTRYAHLSGYAVKAGDRVHKGDLIGYVGSTGRSTGPHLHYEVRIAGEAVNPIPYMTESTAVETFALARGEGGKGGPE